MLQVHLVQHIFLSMLIFQVTQQLFELIILHVILPRYILLIYFWILEYWPSWFPMLILLQLYSLLLLFALIYQIILFLFLQFVCVVHFPWSSVSRSANNYGSSDLKCKFCPTQNFNGLSCKKKRAKLWHGVHDIKFSIFIQDLTVISRHTDIIDFHLWILSSSNYICPDMRSLTVHFWM